MRYIFYAENDLPLLTRSDYINTASGSCDNLSLNFTAIENRTVQIYVANESNTVVWFDEVNIIHEEHLIVQENHYYPFGLNLVGIEKEGTPEHRYQFNKMSEKSEDFGLNIYDTKYRTLAVDAPIWWQVAPKADEGYQSPYVTMDNNPIKLNDPEGDCPICPFLIPILVGVVADAGVQFANNRIVQGQDAQTAASNINWTSVVI